MDLLDHLTCTAGCHVLSDLRYLDSFQRAHLAHALDNIPAETATLHEWNDALAYLGRDPPQQTAAAARMRLIQALSDPAQALPEQLTERKQEESNT